MFACFAFVSSVVNLIYSKKLVLLYYAYSRYCTEIVTVLTLLVSKLVMTSAWSL